MKKTLLFFLILLIVSNGCFAAVNLVFTGGVVPITMYAGNTYNVSYTIKNSGTTSTTTSFYVTIFISSSSTYSSSATRLIDLFVPGGIAANASKTVSTNITIPSNYPTGTKYIIAGVDATNVINEVGGEGDNNFSLSILLQTLPDLTPLTLSLSQGTAVAGNNITAFFSVNNGGSASANNFNVGFYITNSPTLIINNSTYIGGYVVSSLPGSSQTGQLSKTLTIPAGTCPGSYYIHIWTDNNQVVTESVDNNNFAHLAITVTGGSTLAAPIATSSNNSIQTGFQANWNTTSGATGYRLDLSTNSSFSSIVAGYNNLDIGNVNSKTINGLNCNTIYYYRVRAYNSCGNISGNSSTISASTASCSCASCSCSAPSIASNPSNIEVSPSSGATFSTSATAGTPPYAYQWQVSTNGGNNWFNISSTGSNPSYTNWTTSNLSLSGTTTSNNNYQYRCLISSGGTCTAYSTTSNPATLTVNSVQNCTLTPLSAGQPSNIQSNSFTANYQTISGIQSYTTEVSTDINFQNIYASYLSGGSGVTFVGLNPETNYYYRVSYSNGTCTSGYSNTIPVTTTPFINNQPPVASFTISGSNLISVGDVVQFNGLASNGPISSWKWFFDKGTPTSSNSQSVSVKYNTPGSFRVSLTACNAYGCNTYTQLGFINVKPTTNKLAKVPPKAVIGTGSNIYLSPEPVQVGTGTYTYKRTDVSIPVVNGNLKFTRFYNSLNNALDGPLGYGWSHTYNYHLDVQRDPSTQQDTLWNMQYPDGHDAAFIPVYQGGGKSFPLYTGTLDDLRKNNGGDFTLYTKDNHQYHFTSSGQLDRITDLNGNNVILSYAGDNLEFIIANGRTLTLRYSGSKIISVTDPLNRVWAFTYNGAGNLQTAKDAKTGSTNYTYDAQHRMLSIANPLGDIFVSNIYNAATGKVISQSDAYGKATSFSYDLPGTGDATITNPDNSKLVVHHDSLYRKTYIKDEMGFTQSFSYDLNSQVTAYTDQNGVTETNSFDLAGNLLSKTLPGGIVSGITYNSFNSPLQLTDPKGNVSILSYDANDNLASIHLPDNTYQYFTTFSNGLRNTTKDGRGNVTNFTYALYGDLISVSAANGTRSYDHDAAGRLTSVVDENGNVTKITYDENDNITVMENALKRTIVFAYDANNQLISLKDKNGSITSFAYDKKGRLTSRINANLGTTKYSYDEMDNLTSVTDPNGHSVNFAYDKTHHKTSMVNSSGTTQYQYDGIGNVLKVTDATNKTTTYTYSITNKVKTISDALSNTSTFNYDLNDNLSSVADPLSKATVYSYDVMNRLITVLDAANNTTKITYDENGNKKTLTDPNGHLQTFTYDAADRLSGMQDATGNNYSYSYDAAGNNTTINKPTGSIQKVYDAANRIATVINSTGNNYGFTYDDNGNITAMTSSVGTTTMAYDKLNQLIQYTDPFSNKVVIGYDASGNKTSIIYPGNKTVNYTYDNSGHMVGVKDWLGHVFTYTYDAAGRVTKLLYPNGVHCDYAFDNAGRLTGKSSVGGANSVITSSTFTLDPVGNRITEQRKGPILSNLLPSSKVYSYTDDDGMVKDSIWTFTNDNSGNRISGARGNTTTRYSFWIDNKLNSFTDTTGKVRNYDYDALGNRLVSSAGSAAKRYVLDITGGLSQVLQITDGSNAVGSQYVYGAGLLERIDAAGNTLYYQYDAQHNTTALTDASGVVQDTYTYDPFGTLLTHQGNTDQPFTFLGDYGVQQENNSLYYVRARYYDAVNGRFLSKDKLTGTEINPQSLNKYIYSFNSPISTFDINGYFGNADWTDYVDNADKMSKFLDVIKLDKEVIPYWGGLKESLKPETIKLKLTQDIGLKLGEVADVIDYTKKLNDFYYENQQIANDYVDNKISPGVAFWKIVKSAGKVLPFSSNLITLHEDLTKNVNDYMDYKINGAELWNSTFVSSVNTVIPGYKDLINNLGEIYGNAFYELFKK